MGKTFSNQDLEWARTAVTALLKRLTERAARDLQAQVDELRAAAQRLRRQAP